MRAAWPRPAPSLSSSPPRRRRTDKILTPRVPFTAPVAASLRSVPRERTLTLASRRAEPSPPSFSPCAGTHCFYVIHNYKRDLPRAFCSCPHRCLPPVSHRHRTTSVFHRSVSAKPSHPTSLPVRRSWSFLELRSCFPNQEGDTFTAVELWRRRSRR
jgi:hypothetical protein